MQWVSFLIYLRLFVRSLTVKSCVGTLWLASLILFKAMSLCNARIEEKSMPHPLLVTPTLALTYSPASFSHFLVIWPSSTSITGMYDRR
ncbi:hypothetical protein F5B22DRAFT_86100 [Xylaria bambusicola]|uniref:uncharacterized protein n=1 Tax=Xylaria bambusicola TaxID=326684 RepID=UPI0020075723|nr:uncharacterized protein F5B22DRAFT_86100 [Xylaria bambusicola]KAI0517965.1 hypothetical protein F5B22DRAFT_86100 [Xylaria bambusicola]